jgi:hypothetical protein
MKKNDTKAVNIKLLPEDFFLYWHPVILMMHPQKANRAVYWQRLLEIQKMLRWILESIIALENIMNQSHDWKKLFLENNEVVITDEKRYWMHIYLIDNAILRVFACLEKIAQMCRCYLEYKNKSTILIRRKCWCTEDLSEGNCTFGTLLTVWKIEGALIDKILFNALFHLNENKSIEKLRPFRNSFSHKKHDIDSSVWIAPKVNTKKLNSSEEISFDFGSYLPSFNWFRIELIWANNWIIEFLESIGEYLFPRDFELEKK